MPLLFSRLGFPDDYFKSIKHIEDKQRKMYDAQVVVLAILASRYLHGKFVSAGYTDYELEDFYAQCEDIYLKVTRKNNSKRTDERCQAFLKEHYRKTIEYTFNGITDLFPRSIHAVTIKGFILKLILFLFAYAIEKL